MPLTITINAPPVHPGEATVVQPDNQVVANGKVASDLASRVSVTTTTMRASIVYQGAISDGQIVSVTPGSTANEFDWQARLPVPSGSAGAAVYVMIQAWTREDTENPASQSRKTKLPAREQTEQQKG